MKKTTALVSIVIPCYNAEKYLDECIESICNQTYKNLEIILLNDGSKDSSKEILDKWAKKDKRIRAIHKENSGVSSTRNMGIDLATGDYIMFIDSDDYIKPETIEFFIKNSNKNTDLVICSKFELENGVITEFDFQKHEVGTFTLGEYVKLGLINSNPNFFNSPWNKFFKAEVIKNNNLKFNEELNFGEDFMFNMDYLNYCKTVKVCNESLYYYRILETGLARKKRALDYYWNNQLKLNTHLINFLKRNNIYEENKKTLQHFILNVIRYMYTLVCNCGYDKEDTIKEINRIGHDAKKNYKMSWFKCTSKSDLKILTLIKFKLSSLVYNHFHLKENKKKVAILTINDYNNYGNRLQNYAVQTSLTKYGYDVETIQNLEGYWNGNNIFFLKRYIKDFVKRFIRVPLFNRYFNFKKWNKNIKLSKIFIDENHIPEDLTDKYDYFVTGSDQVWNPTIKRFNGADLLSFAEASKRVSFAASFAIDELPKEFHDKAKREISQFKAISVREDKGKDIVKNVVKRDDAIVLVDPTMLLTEEEWSKVIVKPKNVPKGKYILNYFLGELSEKRKTEINKIAEKYDCEIINILDKNDPYYVSGPGEFLYLEKNAFLICTDSFHSSVFAILFNRPFAIFDRDENITSMNSRIETLLSKFKLEDRKCKGKLTDKMLKHNYEEAYKILEEERKKSKEFIEQSLK